MAIISDHWRKVFKERDKQPLSKEVYKKYMKDLSILYTQTEKLWEPVKKEWLKERK